MAPPLPVDRAAWLARAGWGVFLHFLGQPDWPSDEWNRRVDAFDTGKLADQLVQIGAGYLGLTIGQNSGHFCSPNATYDRITGIHPSKCSQRDLIADLADALKPRGIRLLAYIPSGAPAQDAPAVAALRWEWGHEKPWPDQSGPKNHKRLAEFQRHWETILREWSLRWGDRVSGWWVDGVYFADAMYRHPDAPNFQSFAAALRSGNPRSIVCFARGPMPWCEAYLFQGDPEEDYTNGECNLVLPLQPQPRIGTAVPHVFSYLGSNWAAGEPRFPTELVVGYTRHFLSCGGAVTWDVPYAADGTIPQPFLHQLRQIRPIA